MGPGVVPGGAGVVSPDICWHAHKAQLITLHFILHAAG